MRDLMEEKLDTIITSEGLKYGKDYKLITEDLKAEKVVSLNGLIERIPETSYHSLLYIPVSTVNSKIANDLGFAVIRILNGEYVGRQSLYYYNKDTSKDLKQRSIDEVVALTMLLQLNSPDYHSNTVRGLMKNQKKYVESLFLFNKIERMKELTNIVVRNT